LRALSYVPPVAVIDVESGVGPPAVAARSRGPRRVAAAFVAVGFALGLIVWCAHTRMPAAEQGLRPQDRPHVSVLDSQLGGWLWYDSKWYADIAAHHYANGQAARYAAGHQSAAPFFPAYPLLVAAVARLGGGIALAELLTTFTCGLLAALLFHRWARGRLPERSALVGTAFLLVYPYAWYLYGAGYADSLMLCAALGAFLLLEADHPLLAGLAGVLATAARPTGVIVTLGLVAVALERRGVVVHDLDARWRSRWHLHVERLRARDLWVLLSLAGVVAFAAFEWWRFGDPLAFVHAERAWGQPQGAGTWLKLELFRDIAHRNIGWWGRLVAQGVLAFVFVNAAGLVSRRFGWGYALYALLMAFVPAFSTADFMGSGRYLLVCFPVFAAVGAASLVQPTSKVKVHWIEPALPPGSSSVRNAKTLFRLLAGTMSSRRPSASTSARSGA